MIASTFRTTRGASAMIRSALLLGGLLAGAVPAAAQERPPRPWHGTSPGAVRAEAADPRDRGRGPAPDWPRFALYATAGSALGFVGGGSFGWSCCRPAQGGDVEQVAPVLLGAAFGSILGTGVGIYLARPGAVSFARIVGGALLGLVPATAGLVLTAESEAPAPVYVVVFSLSQGITAGLASTWRGTLDRPASRRVAR